jgi:hypothetical protein
MVYTNILIINTSFDPKSSLGGNMALTTSIPSGIKKQGLIFTFITYAKFKKGQNLKTLWENYIILHKVPLSCP